MQFTLESLAQLDRLPFDTVIDVRSPAEFAEDHIPGALNLPVLSDAERAEVGTLYRADPFAARKRGAALVSRNAAAHLEGPLAARPYRWRPLVHCWRGGQRSGAFAVILAEIGWRVGVLAGGYRSYRALVVDALYRAPLPQRLVLIDGLTGTAKTRLLELLAARGAQVLDLEGLANHRGSLLGHRAGGQPSQKRFESRIAAALAGCDPARPVYAEAEAAKVGGLNLPPALWQAMLAAPRLRIEAPLEARAAHLVRVYADLTADRPRLAAALDALRPYHPAGRIARWHGLLAAGGMEALALELMRDHYDPRYREAAARRAAPALHLALPRLEEADLAQAAGRLLAFDPVAADPVAADPGPGSAAAAQ